jgi:hypothetical protein
MIGKKGIVGQELEVRLDLVNVSRINGRLVSISHLYPKIGFTIAQMPNRYVVTEGFLNFGKQTIEPFQIQTIKFRLLPTQEGTYAIAPEINGEEQTGNQSKTKLKPISIKIDSTPQANQQRSEGLLPKHANEQLISSADLSVEFQFTNECAKKAFDYLVKSFTDDYMKSRLPLEKSGWRTLMAATKQGNVPISAMYGRNGRLGRAVSELQRRGLIETRFFPGERGRGGNVMKLRVCYERDPVKRQIDYRIAGNKK